MKLTESTVQLIADRSKEAKALRSTLALALNFTDQWVGMCAKQNKDNGPLTTIKAVQIIKRLTGLNQSDILEESTESVERA